jgi:radical SAM enzyme (TIGR01210 family)
VFCGYSRDCLTKIQATPYEFIKQINHYLEHYGLGAHLEIYNSGSFLDDLQISANSRKAILRYLHEIGFKSIAVESRPEYITKEKLEELTREFKGELTVAIGLEVADDSILQMLNKGFSLADVETAHSILDLMGIGSRVYILAGPPFVKDPKKSALESVKHAKDVGFTEMSLLAAYPMEGSKGYEMWDNGDWLPLNKIDFDDIIVLAQDIEPDIDYSSKDLERFWKDSASIRN